MRLLLDGHNAMHRLRIRSKDHEAARNALLRRVETRGLPATVFFDGHGTGRSGVVFSGKRAADELILEAVRRSERPGTLLVVTDDREVSGRAAQLGARTSGVREFFGESGGAPAAGTKRAFRGRLPKFTPADFGLPDRIDLSKGLPGDRKRTYGA